MVLSGEQLRRFGEDGYLVVPGVVPESLLAAVDHEIDALLAVDPPPAGTVGKHFWFLAPGRLPAADTALRRSGALDIAGELVAPHTVDHALDHIQIALNYPPHAHRPGGPHLDGHRPEQHRPDSFTMLAAIYLVDEQEPGRQPVGLAGLASRPRTPVPGARRPCPAGRGRPLDDARPATVAS